MDVLIHIAGPRFGWSTPEGNQTVQRCLVCGAKLRDSGPRMDLSTFWTWDEMALVREAGGEFESMGIYQGEYLPVESCVVLIEQG